MIRVDDTRERAFTRIVNAVVLKKSILNGAAHLGVHKWTLFQWMKNYPALARKVRAVNERNRAERRGVTPPVRERAGRGGRRGSRG